MYTSIKNIIIVSLFFACFFPFSVSASHSVGGSITYRFQGDVIIAGNPYSAYQITLDLYQDCVTGVPDAIAQDNPAFLTIYHLGNPHLLYLVDSIFYNPDTASDGSILVPLDNLNTKCGVISASSLPQLCLFRKRFVKTYYLPASTTGYVFAYQRCCRNSSIMNIISPGDNGMTLYCNIMPSVTPNSSAEFKAYPPQIACINVPMTMDVGAVDADGDSLSYEFCGALNGANGLDIKPRIASPPPYTSVDYFPPYSATHPITEANIATIDEKTGIISLKADRQGRYLVVVQCNEWRNGVIINSVRREFQLLVVNCEEMLKYQPDAGNDQTVVVGQSLNFNAKGGNRYLWLPTNFLDNPYINNPIGTFTEPGRFTYVVTAENDSGCRGTDTITVNVLEHVTYTVPNAFTPNGDGHNDLLKPIVQGGIATLKNFRVYNRWGNVIFHATNSADGWDGKFNGKEQNPGVYGWSAEYYDNKGETRVSSGSSVLLR